MLLRESFKARPAPAICFATFWNDDRLAGMRGVLHMLFNNRARELFHPFLTSVLRCESVSEFGRRLDEIFLQHKG
jgi:hypothetical protein